MKKIMVQATGFGTGAGKSFLVTFLNFFNLDLLSDS